MFFSYSAFFCRWQQKLHVWQNLQIFFFWTTFWGLYISWGSSDSVTVIQHKPGYWHISEWTGWRHKAWSQSSARKAISHPDDDEALVLILMMRLLLLFIWTVPFAADWSPSAWNEGPPRLVHAPSVAAASARQSHAYAIERHRYKGRREGEKGGCGEWGRGHGDFYWQYPKRIADHNLHQSLWRVSYCAVCHIFSVRRDIQSVAALPGTC